MQTLQVGYSKLDERLKKLIDDYEKKGLFHMSPFFSFIITMFCVCVTFEHK